MDWAPIRTGLLTLIQSVSDIPASNVVWRDQPRPFLNQGAGTNPPQLGDRAQILCAIKNVQSQGFGDWATVFLGFDVFVAASLFSGVATDGQSLWFTEKPPAPFVVNTQYFAVNVTPTTFQLSATSGGSPIAPMLATSSGAVIATMPPGQELQDTLSGILLFDLEIACESYEQEDGLTTNQYLDQIRQRIYRKTSTAAMLGINCAFYDETPTTEPNVVSDDRVVSAGVFTLRVRSNYSEVDGNAYGYIATAPVQQGQFT